MDGKVLGGASRIRGALAAVAAATAIAVALPAPAGAAGTGAVRAGVASVDASWHVGASAGQYATTRPEDPAGSLDHFDPSLHSIKNAPSYGVQSRLDVRAIVVEGPDGKRVAVVKNDNYIPQDLLYRRTAQLLEAGNSGINRANLTMVVSHDHSSPYYSSTAPGAWTFQDVYDIRFYEYLAERMATAVEEASKHLVPVRVGASARQFDKTHRHSFGPQVADDGTPAGYPRDDTDHNMSVVRFDDISDPAKPKPLAYLANFGLHPEFLNGNDLITADYLAPLERIVDRESGAMLIWTQSAVGTSEPELSQYHSVHERLEFSHKEYAQAEYGARLMSDAILGAARDIAENKPEDPDRYVPFQTRFPVAMEDRWFPGPLSHPYPGVSNCRTDKGLGGDPQLPVVGLPDCQGVGSGIGALADIAGLDVPPPPPTTALDPGLSTDDFERAGIPIPENYTAPSYGALQEDLNVHLQAFRLGDILFTICSCEQWKDQAFNIRTRTDAQQDNQYLGYDWAAQCTKNGNGTSTCPDPRTPGKTLPPVEDSKVARMHAQVVNDAKGWDAPEYAPFAESEPVDVSKIKGNYTHEELPVARSYKFTVPIAMANDYNGYIATYREYQRGDHYRKALTAWGPHSSDYMATRLVRMAGHLNGGPDLAPEPLAAKVGPDLLGNDLKAAGLGRIGSAGVQAYQALLPDDADAGRAVEQPKDIKRFAAAFFSWNGGSNFTDQPAVRVQRKVGDDWQDYADQTGEVPVTLALPAIGDAPAYLSGGLVWRWTAHFEAFVSPFDTGARPRSTPAGSYRFVVRGQRQQGGKPVPYSVRSREFQVAPWNGITVPGIRVSRGRLQFGVGPSRQIEEPVVKEPNGPAPPAGAKVTATIGPIDYPDSYRSSARFIKNERTFVRDPAAPNDPKRFEWYCLTCSFRPWLDTAGVSCASAVVVRARTGRATTVRARRNGDLFRVSSPRLRHGDVAVVPPGGVRDRNGEVNGQASEVVARGTAEPVALERARALASRAVRCGARAAQRRSSRRAASRRRPRFTG